MDTFTSTTVMIDSSTSQVAGVTISNTGISPETVLDLYDMNKLCVEQSVTTLELITIKDDVNFIDCIKKNLSKTAADEIIKKMSFTKQTDTKSDITYFRGRVYVFTKDELLTLIRDTMRY